MRGVAYFDISETFRNGRGDEHREGRYDARCEEKRTQSSFLKVEFALKEICDPCSKVIVSDHHWHGQTLAETYSGARPDANESNANSMHRLSTMILLSLLMDGSNDVLGFDLLAFASLSPSRGAVSVSSSGVTLFSASHFRLREMARPNLMRPITAYAKKIMRYARTSDHSLDARRVWTTHPQASIPKAVPAVPTNEYQANMSLRTAAGVRCASVDSSTARNGPISLPLERLVSH